MFFTVDGLTTTTLPPPTTIPVTVDTETEQNTVEIPETKQELEGCELEKELHPIGTEAVLKCPDGFYFEEGYQNLTVVCANETTVAWIPQITECIATDDQLGLFLKIKPFRTFEITDLIDYYKHISLCCFGGFFTSSGVVTVILGYNVFQIMKLQFLLISSAS